MKQRIILITIAICILFLSGGNVLAQKRYIGDPVKKSRLISVLKSKQYRAQDIVEIIRENGVDFRATPSTVQQLFRAGARPNVIQAVKVNFRGSIKRTSKRVRAKDNYQTLLDEAIAQFDEQSDTPGSIETLEKAIKLKPGKPRAYQLLGYAHLYGNRDYSAAEKYMKEAIARGGSAVFKIRHADDASFFKSCEGSLYIDKKGFRYEDDANKHTIDVFGRDIKKVTGKAGYWGFRKIITFKGNMFEVSYRDRTNKKKKDDKDIYRFAPVSGKKKEKKMIVKLLKKLS